MKIAISHPEHFPYMGYFEKMVAVDLFVILDNIQFSGPRSFQNRNRFINQQGNMQWFTVPVAAGSYYKMIKDVVVAPDFGWRKKLKKTMEYNHFSIDFEDIYGHESLFDINMKSIEHCRKKLNINVPVIFTSELNAKGKKAELIYNICKELGADRYISGLGAYEYMERSKNLFSDVIVEYFFPVTKDYESTLAHISKPSLFEKSLEIIRSY